ncbi:MAG TPA: ATP-binding protein [Rhodopseudomonas sp.]|uniref:ATP-binding protein n=1 Tax=Rhodopseudomonas sp. TaxID=1078 RepID=UPI002ED89DEB
MWQKLSLRARLNALMALVLLLGLVINNGRLLLEAAPRVRAEDQSVVRLARELIESMVIGLGEVPDPETKLSKIVDDLSRLRHITITREGDAAAPPPAETPDASPHAPAWFVAMVRPEQTSVSVPISVDGRAFGALQMTPHPDDEIFEIWDGLITQIEVGVAIGLIVLLTIMSVVGRALAPLQSLGDAMARIEAGRYDTRVTPGGSPELAAICDKLNHLAEALQGAVDDKDRLAERIVSLQDAERREIARELHDEFGPYLFALRAHASSLTRIANAPRPDLAALARHGGDILAQVNELQQFNRRVLKRLRPAGLDELGLPAALDALLRLWREAHPAVQVEIAVSPTLGEARDTTELTIYRIVQEALTNVFRHAGATRVEVTVEPIGRSPAGPPADAVLVRVKDDGGGLPPDHRLGLGLTGMRERVLALGGALSVGSSQGGVTVEAIVPWSARSEVRDIVPRHARS